MKEIYNSPKLDIVIFAPVERLSTELLPPFSFDLNRLTQLSNSAGNPTISREGDIFLPIW